MTMAVVNNILTKIGLSWHDIFIIILLFETCWWGMFAFMDSADTVIRAVDEASKTEYHIFVIVQKIVSLLKLTCVLTCLWYGTIVVGKGAYPRIYLIVGIFIDIILTISWILISIEESWPLSPANIFGIHYILTFILLRFIVYTVLYCFTKEMFTSRFGPPVIGTTNGTVMGIPEQGNCRTVNCGSDLGFLGKGVKATLEHYRLEVERSFLVAVIWDVLWNWATVMSQELPEVAFNYVLVGIFGSSTLDIPTDDLIIRSIRIVLGLFAVFLVVKKSERFIKIWICVYVVIMILNIALLLFICIADLIEETWMGNLVLCTVFFASNIAKIFIIFCSIRYYFHLRKANECLINGDGNNEINTM